LSSPKQYGNGGADENQHAECNGCRCGPVTVTLCPQQWLAFPHSVSEISDSSSIGDAT
jgi:hypothetical protein